MKTDYALMQNQDWIKEVVNLVKYKVTDTSIYSATSQYHDKASKQV